MEIGKFQFDYLVGHGLKPHHRLNICCGNLRLGSMRIAYLNPNCYVGVDISPTIVCAAFENDRRVQLATSVSLSLPARRDVSFRLRARV